ncbi:MAG: PQQ-binding-like beta-propeller repeat protein [Planctomycetales bacterium]|nr:PQQ-binding-like beta-propeller repeat protein [Planctomycetales bacterium]
MPISVVAQSAPQQATEILRHSGVAGGVIVHLGAGDGELTAALSGPSRVVLGLCRDSAEVERARSKHVSHEHYGAFLFDTLAGKALPLIDNTVNLVIIGPGESVAKEELLRVLTPGGKAVQLPIGSEAVLQKPVPAEIDQWTHYLHDASGNAVAHDEVVGPPKHLQWLGHPRWSRHHDRMASMSALVSSAGRLYYIMDEGSRVSIQLPAKWMLIAKDAFNGVELWRQPIADWQSHLWPLKSGPTQLARRLVSTDRHVFATLAFEAPLTQLDAATGKILREYEGTKATEELLHIDGMLLVQVNEGPSPLSEFAPEHNVGDQRRVASEFTWNGGPRWLKAIDVESGKTLWSVKSPIAPLSLSADDQYVLFHSGERLVCLNRADGTQRWSVEAPRRDAIANHFGPKIVLHEGVVLYSGGDRNLLALDAETGKQLWTAPKPPSAYQSPEDLLVVGGLVWTAPTTSGRDSGTFVGRDPKTGEVKKEFSPNVDTYWFHHRCYIAKATDRFIIPSRTGIEFIDFKQEDWDIHHWVRGGCLYGVLPANGLLYAPPHNCACYPEAKLFGFNALAPRSETRVVPDEPANPLTKGPAYGQVAHPSDAETDDAWPTFRHDNLRSGSTETDVSGDLQSRWTADLGGNLTSLVMSGGRVYVAQTDRHTLHALNAKDGAKAWSYTAGGRIDSPPTIERGHVLFGCADGNVYCLRADDGELVWRLQAAPEHRKLMAFDQLESVWPVHGSVLAQEGQAFFVAGRSNFLDGGLWWFKVDVSTGDILSRQRIDDRDPGTGSDLQDRLQTLQMPVGLPDILSGDGQRVFMRSQAFDLDGNRQDIGPISGQPAQHASVQQGETAHMFAPMGFLDDTWFHRSYWVYGRNFAGGHNGYYQAGRFAPAGRILVSDKEKVYGFGRKPEYLKWTTTIEHQLFSANKIQPTPPAAAINGGGGGGGGGNARSNGSVIRLPMANHLNPTGQPLTVSAWVRAERPGGVVVARGGPQDGYALHLSQGKPLFTLRRNGEVFQAAGEKRITGVWTHLAGVLSGDGKLTLYVDGQAAGTSKAPGVLTANPKQAMEIGADDGGAVGNYQSPGHLTGMVDEVRLYHESLDAAAVKQLAEGGEPGATAVLSLSFNQGDATDSSTHRHHGVMQNVRTAAGKFGRAAQLTGGRGGAGGGGGNAANKSTYVEHNWTLDLPLLARAMTSAGDALLICGPPDVMDEEQTFQQLAARDETVQPLLNEQQRALDGQLGATLLIVSKEQGTKRGVIKLDALPVWDGMISVGGQVFLADTKGKVICLAPRGADAP